MEEKALAIISEISCDGISGGIYLRRGDAGRSQARRSPIPCQYISGHGAPPSPAARTSPALRISQDGSYFLTTQSLIVCRFANFTNCLQNCACLDNSRDQILLIRLEVEEQLNRNKSYIGYASIRIQFSDRNIIPCGIEDVV